MTVLTERVNEALILTIDRPEARNSLNAAVGEGLVAALSVASEEVGVRTVVLTGSGTGTFCSGLDLKALAAGEDLSPVGHALDAVRSCPKPVIAAINGSCLAGGFELMMLCDLVIAAEEAMFGLPEVKRGLLAAGGGTRLPKRLPLAIALEIGLTGDPISANEAKRWGLVNQVVDGNQLRLAVVAMSERIAANGPLAVQATKALMRAELGLDAESEVQAVAASVSPAPTPRRASPRSGRRGLQYGWDGDIVRPMIGSRPL